MAKQLNVSLAFTADTSKAKAELQDLQRQLTQLTNAPISNSGKGFFLTKEIQEATAAAADLKIKLQQATDVNTGKLDLNKFDQSLKNSGTSLKTYREALSNLGPAGDKVFASLATSIMKADVPLKTTNKLLNEFKITLMNTARWQISSSILHGFMGTLQSAYGYAQDLNQSLNNIRIVTGYSNDEMAKFAESANKAAQSLSTTTTRYTDAALIYYQQGIRDQEEIAGRTETTIKLANISRQSAEEVSSQMTAIWNNFDDGSHSLEYYADVITALGANTASSSQEIAKGMQQFAAVADTVGLSYEYAAASLATIVATTRQSESTVGNGLRTIFSRLEGLKLGDTLEDGTDLNKYSAALATIGVNIKDTTGNLKDMDTILEETASKWDTLDKAQKVAFATTVGGVRQYTNLIALLDNWDMVQENIGIAKNSEGTLQEQADIYAESWEAAQKRVRAAAEEIYQELLNDDFFITLLDGFKEVLDIINNTIDAIGGLKGVLIAVGAIVTNLFQKEIASEINRIGQNIRIATGQAAQATTARKAEAAQEMQQMTANSVDENTGNAMSAVYTQQGQLQQELINNAGRLSDERKKELQTLLDINNAIGQSVIKINEAADAAEKQLATDERRLLLKSSDIGFQNDISNYTSQMKNYGTISAGVQGLKAAFKEASIEGDQINISLENVNSCLERLKNTADGINFEDDAGATEEIKNQLEEAQTIINQMQNASGEVLEGLKKDAQDTFEIIDKLTTQAGNARIKYQVNQSSEDKKEVENLGTKAFETGQQVEGAKQSVDYFRTSSQKLGQDIKNPTKGMTDFGKQVTAAASTVTTTIMVINNLTNAIKTLANPDLNGFEKFTGILGSLAMTVPMVISTLTQLTTAFGSVSAAAHVAVSFMSGPVGIAIGAITIAAIGLYEICKKQKELEPENQLKKINEELEKTKNLLKDTTTEVNNLKTAFSNYDIIVDKLKNADRATAEWKNSLIDAQVESQKLINAYSLIKDQDYFYNESGGFIEFTEAGKNKTTNIVNSRQTSAQLYTNAAAIKSYQKQIDINSEKIKSNNELYYVNDLVNKYNSMIDYNATGSFRDKASNYHMNYDQMISAIENPKGLDNIKKGIESVKTSNTATAEEKQAADWQLNALDKIESDLNRISTNWDSIQAKVENDNTSLEKKNNLLKEQIELTQQQSILTANRNTDDYNANAEFLYSKQLKGTNEAKAREKIESLSDEDKAKQYYQSVYGDKAKVDGNKVQILQDDNTWGEAKKYDIASITEQLIAEAMAQPSNQEEINEAFNNALASIKDKDIDESTKNNLANLMANATLENSDKLDLKGMDLNWLKDIDLSKLSILKDFKDQLQNYQNALQRTSLDFNTIIQDYSNAHKIIDSLKDDSKITKEEYLSLESQYQQYFKLMSDGTYGLIEDAEKLQELLNKDTSSALQESISQTTAKGTAVSEYQQINNDNGEGYTAIESLQTEINLIKEIGDQSLETQAKVEEWQSALNNNSLTIEQLNEIGTALSTIDTSEENLNNILKETSDAIIEQTEALAMSASTINEANGYLKDIVISEEEYHKVIQSAAKAEAKAHNLDFDKVSTQAKQLAKAYNMTEDAALSAAIANQRMNKGIETLNKNFSKWKDTLSKAEKTSGDYADVINNLEDTLTDLLNISSKDYIPDGFLELPGVMENIEKASTGDINAIRELGFSMGDATVKAMQFPEALLSSGDEVSQILGRFDAMKQTVLNGIDDLKNAVADGSVQIGDTLGGTADIMGTDWVNALNAMAYDTGMSVEAMNALLNELGVEADVTTIYKKQKVKVPEYTTRETIKMTEAPDPSTGKMGAYEKVSTTVQTGTKELDGEVPVAQINTGDKSGTAPSVHDITYTGGGTSGGVNPSSVGSGRGGGGGGGGGGKEAKPAKKITLTKKDGEKEVDRYIKINQELAQKEHESNLLKTKLDSTSGQTAIKVMKEQLGILHQQKKLYSELAKEAEDYRVKDLEKLKEDFSELNFEIGADGMLTNYETLLKEQTEIYNKVYKEWADKLEEAEKAYIDEMTRLGEAATDEAMKPFQDKIDEIKEDMAQPLQDAQEQYDKFKKDTDKYNESVETARKAAEDKAAAILEAYNQELDIIAKGIDLKIKVDDADLQYLEFLLKQIGDGADKALDRMSNYTKSINDNMSKIDTYQEGLYEVLDHAGIDMEDLLDGDIDDLGSFNENDLAKIEEFRDGLISCGEQLIELRKTLLNEVSEAFDEFNSDLDRAISKIDHLKSFTNTYKNLINIVGKDVVDPTGRTTIMLAQTAYTQAESNTKALKDQLDFQLSAIEDYNRTIAELEADNENGVHDDTIKEFKNQLKEAEDAYQSAQENWLSSLEETVQAAADIYEAELNQIVEDFGKSISGLAGSLADLSQQYERTKNLQDTYVDDYEKIYQLSKLNRDINKSIDDTDNIRGKERLRELQSQINDLQNSEKEMSEYELENLRRRYELELASFQLEETKDAKSQVRMMRDNEGNWGYIYTADEAAVEEAEQNYEDKLYAMQKANTEYIESLESEILQLQQEWADALAEIKVQDYTSYEEYMSAVDACNDYYSKKLDQSYDQMNIVIDENKKLYDEDWTAYSAATGYKISEDERFLDDFNETNYSMLTGYQTIQEATDAYHEAVSDSIESATSRMSDAYEEWQSRTNTALELGGTDIQNYSEDVNEAINGSGGVVEQTIDATNAVNDMANEYDAAFTDIINYAENFAMDFDSVIDGIIDGCNRAIEAIQRLLEAMAEADNEDYDNDYSEELDDYDWVNLKEGTGDYDWRYRSKSTGKDKIGDFEADYTINGTTYRANYKTDASGTVLASAENSEHNGYFGASNVRELSKSMDNLNKTMNQMIDDTPSYVSSSKSNKSNEKIDDLPPWLAELSLDTGGYTGDWGNNDGRVALLHKKELVLNADDTENILSAVDMIRSISKTIDLNAATASGILSNMLNINAASSSSGTLQQSVTITAEFPNVQNRSEIEEAFDNLVNKAAQYANRKV